MTEPMTLLDALAIVREEAQFCRECGEKFRDNSTRAFWLSKATAQETLLAEVAHLQSIVDRLPKTADGVPVVPGEDSVWHPSIRDKDGNLQAMALDIDHGAAWWRLPNQRLLISQCYSTREAAEKAAGGSDES